VGSTREIERQSQAFSLSCTGSVYEVWLFGFQHKHENGQSRPGMDGSVKTKR